MAPVNANKGSLRVKRLRHAEELTAVLQGRGRDFWVTFLTGDFQVCKDRLPKMRVSSSSSEPVYAHEVFTHVFLAPAPSAKAAGNRLLESFGLGLRQKMLLGGERKGFVIVFVNNAGESSLAQATRTAKMHDRGSSVEDRLNRTHLAFADVPVAGLDPAADESRGAFLLTCVSDRGLQECRRHIVTSQWHDSFRRCLIAQVPDCKSATECFCAKHGLGLRNTAVRARSRPGCLVLLLDRRSAPAAPVPAEAAACVPHLHDAGAGSGPRRAPEPPPPAPGARSSAGGSGWAATSSRPPEPPPPEPGARRSGGGSGSAASSSRPPEPAPPVPGTRSSAGGGGCAASSSSTTGMASGGGGGGGGEGDEGGGSGLAGRSCETSRILKCLVRGSLASTERRHLEIVERHAADLQRHGSSFRALSPEDRLQRAAQLACDMASSVSEDLPGKVCRLLRRMAGALDGPLERPVVQREAPAMCDEQATLRKALRTGLAHLDLEDSSTRLCIADVVTHLGSMLAAYICAHGSLSSAEQHAEWRGLRELVQSAFPAMDGGGPAPVVAAPAWAADGGGGDGGRATSSSSAAEHPSASRRALGCAAAAREQPPLKLVKRERGFQGDSAVEMAPRKRRRNTAVPPLGNDELEEKGDHAERGRASSSASGKHSRRFRDGDVRAGYGASIDLADT